MPFSEQVLNEALHVYVETIPTPDRLAVYLDKQSLAPQAAAIKAALDAVLADAGQHLAQYPGGVCWTVAFEQGYGAFLQARHPWLNQASLDRVLGFSRWLCWHDGYNAWDGKRR